MEGRALVLYRILLAVYVLVGLGAGMWQIIFAMSDRENEHFTGRFLIGILLIGAARWWYTKLRATFDEPPPQPEKNHEQDPES